MSIMVSQKPSGQPTAQHPNAQRKTWVSPKGVTWYADYWGEPEPADDAIRRMVEPTPDEVAAERAANAKQSATTWILSSDDPNAVAVRCLFRALLKMPPANRKWSDLAAAARQEIANENDPNA